MLFSNVLRQRSKGNPGAIPRSSSIDRYDVSKDCGLEINNVRIAMVAEHEVVAKLSERACTKRARGFGHGARDGSQNAAPE